MVQLQQPVEDLRPDGVGDREAEAERRLADGAVELDAKFAQLFDRWIAPIAARPCLQEALVESRREHDDQTMREMVDPEGRLVVLTLEAWEHIVDAHREMAAHLDSIVEAIEAPTVRTPGREGNEEWFFLRDPGPSRWLHVVVHFVAGEGAVTTAFGRRRIP